MTFLSAPYFHDEIAAHVLVEGIVWPSGPVCPKCNGAARITRVRGGRSGLYRCGPCKRQFTVKVGAVFESSHLPLNQWLQIVHMMISSRKGVSSHQVMRTLDVQYKTAWFATMRIREAMKELAWPNAGKLGGAGSTAEANETYVGGKAANRAYGSIPPKHAVASLVERGGKVRSFHVPNVTADNLYPIVARHVHADSRFMTDESNVYTAIGRTFKGGYETVNHSVKEYVRDDAYTNTAKGYFSILKRGIYGIYQHVSAAHLHRYLHEFDFRYSHRIRTGYDDMARFEKALAGIVCKRLMYRQAGGSRAAAAAS